VQVRLSEADPLDAFRIHIASALDQAEGTVPEFRRRWEAEDAQIVRGSVNRVDMRASAFRSNRFSGNGFVEWLSEIDSRVTFEVEVPESGAYTATLAYGNGGVQAGLGVRVDDEHQSELLLMPTQGHELLGLAMWELELPRGSSKISLVREGRPGSVSIDYLELAKASLEQRRSRGNSAS
jgi:hypothetical protein